MKKLNLAIIGQGRSGRDIHGAYYHSEKNKYYNVKYVVDMDENRRKIAEKEYEGAEILSSYTELFDKKDIDVVVNATFSEMHYPITKDLLSHGFNVLSEKPFARNRYECEDLIRTADEKGCTLAVFHNTQTALFYLDALRLTKDGTLGEIKQISIRYNSLARRWDWQTLQKKLAGSLYNTGPHPVAMALGFLDFDENTRVAYSKLDTALTSGDADDYCKIILVAPGKPVVDIEINSTDAFCDYNVKLQGTKGTFKAVPKAYKMKYIVDGENPERPVIEEFIHNDDFTPTYCKENLIAHEVEGEYDGTAFTTGTAAIYESLYYKLTENRPLIVTNEMAKAVVGVIENVHAENPLKRKF